MALIPPDAARKKVILDEINATEKQLESNKNVLKEWLKQNPHLPQEQNDFQLLNFIIQSKNSLERAKEWMETYYTRHLSSVRDSFVDNDPNSPEMLQNFDVVSHSTCRTLSPEGFRIQIFKIEDPDITKYDPGMLIKRIFTVGTIRATEEYLNGGELILIDCTHFSVGHMARLTPMKVKQAIFSAKLVPCRLKQIICFNAPSMLNTFMSIVKSFLDEKMRNRMYVYSEDHTSLYQHVPKEILPKDFGGDDLSIKELNEYWKMRSLKARDWLLDKSIQESDESKRIGEIKQTRDQMFGVQGSFKTLAID